MSLLDKAFDVVANRLPAVGVECLLIGGFAVNHYGYSRQTLDVDFMIVSERLDSVRKIMVQEGFINVAVHENVVFFHVPDSVFRVDFLRSDAETMRRLMVGARLVQVHGYSLNVPDLKDLIAMKIFALSQAPARRMAKDLPDIAYLSVLNGLSLEADLKPLCERFGNPASYELIRRQVEELQT